MKADDVVLLIVLLAFAGDVFIVGRIIRKLQARIVELEKVSHPPVDVRRVAQAFAQTAARAEVKRVLEEHVP